MAETDKKRYTNKKKIDPISVSRKRWLVPRTALVEDERVSRDLQTKNQRLQLDKLRAVVEKTIERVNDGTGIMELLPDLNLIAEILVASIHSPKDLTDFKLKVTTDLQNVPPELLEKVRVHFSSTYNLEADSPRILRDALFEIGSYILLPVPASGLNSVMNANAKVLESLSHRDLKDMDIPNIGIVGAMNVSASDHLVAMESLTYGIYQVADKTQAEKKAVSNLLTIVDNPLHLLGPSLLTITQRVNVRKRLKDTIGLEGIEHRYNGDKNVYMRKMYDFVESIMLKNQKLEEVGVNLDPIIINLPAEAVIPVFVPGEPSKHVGYYVILDEYGNPIRASKNSNFFRELNEKLEQTITSGSNTMIRSSLNVKDIDEQKMAMNMRQPIMDAYIMQLEKELRDAIKNGVYGENVEISRPAELFRLMFARQLEKMQTRALYVPAEMLTYVAFDHDEMGIGLSLIEKTKLYSSLRAILMFAEVMAGIKNSVPGRILNITLDENDPDPQGTIETVLQEFSAMNSIGLPLGKLNPSEIVDGIQKANIQVKVDGGEVFPNTGIEIEDRHREMTKPDSELSEFLKKQQYSGMGVSPELADRGLEGDFATGIAQANLLQAKRVMVWQNMYSYHLSDHMHKYIFAGGPLFKELKEMWGKVEGDNKVSFEEMICSLKFELPKPDTAVITAQSAAYNEYATFIETAVTTHINDDMIRNLLKGEYAPDAVASYQQAIINVLKRQYMRKQNILPELDELLTSEDSALAESLVQHNTAILKLFAETLPALYSVEYVDLDKRVGEILRGIEKMKEADNPDGSSDESGSDTGGEDTGGGEGGEDTGAGGEMDTGDDLDMSDLGLDSGDEEGGGAEEKPSGAVESEEAMDTGEDLKGEELGLDKEEEGTTEEKPAAAKEEATPAKEEPEAKKEEPKKEEPKKEGEDKSGLEDKEPLKEDELGLDKKEEEKK